jgi:dienelactone hydrolase
MQIEDVEYKALGHRMVGRLVFDESRTDRRPGVLLCHEGPGLDDHVKSRAERIAGLGYVAFALDYHGGGTQLPRDAVMDRVVALLGDPDQVRALGYAGLDVLAHHDRTDTKRVAAVGYCLGGTMALELARSGADLRAVVGFHSGLKTTRPGDARNIRGSVLVCVGADDPLIPREERLAFEEEMGSAAVADWQLELYGGVGHSFTNPAAADFDVPGVAYHAAADRRSWASMVRVLDEMLAG